MKSPLKWYGGKQKIASRILQLFPAHRTYVEVFGGAGHLLLQKQPSKVEVFNDLDNDVVNLFRVLRDHKAAQRLAILLELTPYARAEHEHCRENAELESDPVERARMLLVRVRQSYNAIVDGSWRHGHDVGNIRPFYSAIDAIEPACRRLRDVYIENQDFEALISRWDRQHVLHYLDPPYLSQTRSAGRAYSHEMTEDDHRRLLSLLQHIRGMAVLSGYAHPIYEEALADWIRLKLPTRCWSTPGRDSRGMSQTKGHRIEVVWINPAAAKALADDGLPIGEYAKAIERNPHLVSAAGEDASHDA